MQSPCNEFGPRFMLNEVPRREGALLETEDPDNLTLPEGPSTQYLRTLVPKAILLMVFGTKVLKYWVLGPLGSKSTDSPVITWLVLLRGLINGLQPQLCNHSCAASSPSKQETRSYRPVKGLHVELDRL